MPFAAVTIPYHLTVPLLFSNDLRLVGQSNTNSRSERCLIGSPCQLEYCEHIAITSEASTCEGRVTVESTVQDVYIILKAM